MTLSTPPAPPAAVLVQDETVDYDQLGEVANLPAVTNEPTKPLAEKVSAPAPAPPTEEVSTGSKSPILLYNWSFKVMANEMIVLLGYRRYMFTQNLLEWPGLVTYNSLS